MRANTRLAERFAPANDVDPRDGEGAEVIDLATRNVLPAVARERKRSDAFGLMAGIAVVGLLGAVTLWSMDTARTVKNATPKPAVAAAPAQPAAAPAVPAQAVTPPPGAAPAAPAPQSVLAAPPQGAVAVAPMGNPLGSPTVVFDASALPLPMSGTPVATGTTGNGNDDFAARLGGVGGGKAAAASSVVRIIGPFP